MLAGLLRLHRVVSPGEVRGESIRLLNRVGLQEDVAVSLPMPRWGQGLAVPGNYRRWRDARVRGQRRVIPGPMLWVTGTGASNLAIYDLRAFSRPLRAPRPGKAEAYVRAIMVNLYVDETRRRSRWARIAPLLAGRRAAADPADLVASRDAMLTVLSGLPPRQRACVVLRYYEDQPVAEIAKALGVAEGTVKRHLSEAMAQMALRLSAAGRG